MSQSIEEQSFIGMDYGVTVNYTTANITNVSEPSDCNLMLVLR